mgnify:CR=1 FL=1
MILNETYTLPNGVEIPKLGLGTWMIDDQQVVAAVQEAIGLGYRHIDTAQAYANERGVGEGVRASGVARGDLFITTKVDAGAKSYEAAAQSIDGSLEALGMDYIDLMIIHSPHPWTEFRGDKDYFAENREVWKALEDAYEAGKVHAIGLSNFEQADIENILEFATVKPMVNQILAHISNTPLELIEYTQAQGILVEAYSPVAHGELLKNEQVQAIAATYGVTVPQLSIRYDLQLGLLPLPKTKTPAHMASNAELDFVISDEDMETLKHIERIADYGDASFMPVFGGTL